MQCTATPMVLGLCVDGISVVAVGVFLVVLCSPSGYGEFFVF